MVACSASAQRKTVRSPSYDYPADGPFGTPTADGDSLGADKQSASDKLRTGPRAGNQGVQGPDYPATEEEEQEEELGAEQEE